MSKDLPSVFKNTINKKIDNNKSTFYSHHESIGNVLDVSESTENDIATNNGTLTENLDSLFKKGQFVFNVPVVITTKNNTINTKILSKVGDHLLTSSGEVIKLDDLVSVKVKE